MAETVDLRRHLKEIEKDNAAAKEWDSDEMLDQVIMLADICASHLASARQAAWRRELGLTGNHLTQARSALILALKAFNGTEEKPK